MPGLAARLVETLADQILGLEQAEIGTVENQLGSDREERKQH
jgi:hypothetical protein